MGQPAVDLEKDKAYYLNKSNNLKIGGWLVLSSGIAIAAIGGLIQLHDYNTWQNDEDTWAFNPDFRGLYAVVGGGCLAITSTPLFIFAGVNKRKALSFSINQQNTVLYDQAAPGQQWIPSVSVTVKL